MKTFFLIFSASIAIGIVSLSYADSYDRKDFNYRSYKPDTSIGLAVFRDFIAPRR